MTNQAEKCATLAALHASDEAWVIPNPWDIGSAKDLEKHGFKALATSSAACAYTLGLKDGEVSLEQKLAYCDAMARCTTVPLSVDFEDGYDNDAASVAANIQRLAATGVAGCSIEDFSRVDQKVFDFNHAVERIDAAVAAVSALDMPFQLVARADGFLRKQYDLDEAIKRLQAFSAAGAHVLYTPGLNTMEQIQQVVDNTDRPLNVLSPFFPGVSVSEFSAAGVNRLSLGDVLLTKVRTHFNESVEQMVSAGAAS
ncbi:MAG: isocitrate lyase/phosphoenolpyruvate mutase family protein [Pseudomonadaceae bacterium]|nr:isocitrate lyase/phosphoenolpyruvate mutase family protein [Pseudomonadaceae bacterium]